MRLAIVGDTHGNSPWVHNVVLVRAEQQGCERIIQLGDFGFVWPEQQWQRNLDKISRKLVKANIEMYFLPGNHEDHPKLRLMVDRLGVDANGHTKVRDNLFYLGRYSAWTWDNHRFGAVGGAVSVDRDWRVNVYLREFPNRKPIWWADEILSPEEHQASLALGPVETLFTHDAPTCIPANWLKPDLQSQMNRQRMDEVGRALRPRWWYHGHYHYRAVYPFRHDDGECEVNAMDCDDTTDAITYWGS